MSLIQPRTVAGTLELLPREQVVFQHVMDVIRRGYERFGFVPVETPVLELKDILLTKSGGETEKQVYFVQSTGALQQGHEPDVAMRFDLTVPLARYVAMRERDLAFPFRRYQIQRSYRGERAQKGRFREFYQADIDVIGKDKLDPAFDAELPAIVVQILTELGVKDFVIHFSNRKILLGLMMDWGISDPETQKLAVREIDKLDKIGVEKVREALLALNVAPDRVETLMKLVALKGGKDELLDALRALPAAHPVFVEGREEVIAMVSALRALGVPEDKTVIDLAITRGLDYYTGTVYETKIVSHPEFGSICSGGRYENLASHYTKSKLPGVGLSIGLTRLFDLFMQNDMLPPAPPAVDILVTQMEVERRDAYLTMATRLRGEGFRVENYLEPAKMDKQLKYADKTGVPVVLIVGSREAEAGTVVVKDMARKAQHEVALESLPTFLHELLGR